MLSLVTFPLIARHLTLTEFGTLDFFLTLSSFGVTLFVFGQDSSVARFFYEYENNLIRRQLISQSLSFQLIGLIIVIPLLWISSDWISNALLGNNDHKSLYRIVLLQTPFLLIINFSQNLLKWTSQRSKYLFISLGMSCNYLFLIFIAIYIYDSRIYGILLINLGNCVIFASLGLYFVREWLTRPSSFDHLKVMLPFAIPYGVLGIVSNFSPTLERVLINSSVGLDSLGLYAAATKLAMIITLITGSFQVAWGPFSMSLFKEHNSMRTFNSILNLFAILICISTLCITLFSEMLVTIIASEKYRNASTLVFPIVMSLCIQSISWITEIGIGISKRTYLNFIPLLISVFATFIGIYILTPFLEILGVCLAILFASILKSFLSSWLAQRAYPMRWSYFTSFFLIATTLICGGIATWLRIYNFYYAANMLLIICIFSMTSVFWITLRKEIKENNAMNAVLISSI